MRSAVCLAVPSVLVVAVLGLAGCGSVAAEPAPHRVPGLGLDRDAAGRLTLPPGARGLGVVAGGRLWAVVRDSGGLHGTPVRAAALAPGGRRLAVGRGRTLAVLRPDGRRIWARRMRGPVVALAWRPDGRRVAYIARVGGRHQLDVVAADGSRLHPQLAVAHSDVRPVTPAWRGNRGLVGVDARGRVFLDEQVVGSGRRLYLFPRACNTGFALRGLRVRALAVAPGSGRVALIGDGGRVVALDPRQARPRACVVSANAVDLTGLAWISPTELLTTERARSHRGFPGYLRRYRVVGNALRVTAARSVRGAALLAVAAGPDGETIALLAVGDPRRPGVLPPGPGTVPLRRDRLAVWTLPTPRGGTRPQPLRPRATHLLLDGPVARRAFRHGGRTSLALDPPPPIHPQPRAGPSEPRAC